MALSNIFEGKIFMNPQEQGRQNQFWQDHFSKEVKIIFQLTKNQMHG